MRIKPEILAAMQRVLDDMREYVRETKEQLAQIRDPALRKSAMR